MNQLSLLDLLTIASFVIAIQNLSLNEQQTESLDKHLGEQDQVLEGQLIALLKKAIEQNEEIIRLLKEKK